MPRRNRPQREVHRSKKGFLNMVEWLTSILVSLSVGFSMIGEGFGMSLLTLPSWIGGDIATAIVGWVIVAATFVGVAVALFRK